MLSAIRTASSSSGASSSSPRPSTTCFAYTRACLAVVDRGHDDARAVRVEQRDRRRLAAGQLVVGVEAHERAVGDRAVEPRLDLGEPLVDRAVHDVDVVAQVAEGLVELGGVGDEVALRAWRRGPRTARRASGAAAPSRRSPSRARSARAPAAASATMPVVVERSSTTGESSRATGRRGAQRVKIAVYVWQLLSVFSSPGTLPTSTSMVTGVPIGGACGQRDRDLGVRARLRLVDALARADALAVALDPHRDVDVGLVVLALVGEGDVEADVRAGGDAVGRLAGLQRDAAGGDAHEAVAVQAGRGRRRRSRVLPPPSAPSRSATKFESSHSRLGRNWLSCDLLAADLLLGERPPG